MGRKKEYIDVTFTPELEPLVEELIKLPHIKRQLLLHHLKENFQGVARLALYKLLEDSGISKPRDNRKG